ncbi:MAG: efflux RND transporter periplasmic adaptor subunit [Anaerolineaceae bacterium]|nr:efflux RND transporter periplasmic adaptor subunit [Anaerolineaceae bacterium]
MKKKNSKRLYWLIGVVIVAIAVVLYSVISSASAQKKATASLQTQKLEVGDLTAIVGATGTVRANQSAVLSWQTSGRVSEINVKVGDRVASNQVLASLLESSLPQSIILARADLVEAEKALDTLLNSNLSKAQAQLNLANAKDAYDRARWNSTPADIMRTTDQNKIDAARAAVTLAEDRVKDAQEAYDRVDDRDDDDPLKASALSALANAKIALENAKKNLNYYTQIPDEKEVAISDAKIAVALAQYEDAQREWERLKDGADPDDVAAAEARIAAIKATIDMAKITAPFAGTVTEISSMVGDQVTAGTVCCRIDDLSRLLVDVAVPEVDINRIKVGQDVQLTFDAINAAEYQGRVIEVAKVGTMSAGMVNFKVTIEVLNPDEQVLPGMTAAVNIIVSQVENVLTVPNRAVRVIDNQQVIYILKNNIPTKVEVVIGASSDTMSEIVSGKVKAGDIVILNPSTNILDLAAQGGFAR